MFYHHICRYRRVFPAAPGMLLLALLACLGVSAQGGEEKGRIVFPTDKPDLELTDFQVKGTLRSGGDIAIAWSVRNSSEVTAPENWQDCLFISNTRTFSTTQGAVHCVPFVKHLVSGKGYSRTAEVSFGRLGNGTYYLFMVANAQSAFSESSTANNVKMWGPISVGGTVVLKPELDRVFISRDMGEDDSGLGTEDLPLKTLATAVSHAANYATADRKVELVIGGGIYDDVLELPDNVVLKGSNPFDPGETVLRPSFNKMKGLGAGIRIEGNGAAIRDLTIEIDPSLPKGTQVDMPLLEIYDSSAKVDNVVFNGQDTAGSVGIESWYTAEDSTAITRCVFENLDAGLRTWDSAPIVARNIFKDMEGPVISVYDSGIKLGVNIPMLGEFSNPATGFNSFHNISGIIIENQTSQMLKVEMNDWGGILLPELGNFLDGPADGDPDIISLTFHSTLHITVLDDETNQPIYDASVTISPGVQPPLTQNVDGVYTYSLIPAGNYTVEASAPGYYANDVAIVVMPPNIIVESVLRLSPDGTQPKAASTVHQTDTDADSAIGLSELLRGVQLYNATIFRCLMGTEDGYAPGQGDTASCSPYAGDFSPNNWRLSLSELLRLVQLFSLGGYAPCEDGEDGYCAG